MITLQQSLSAWNTNSFEETYRAEILNSDIDAIPLYLATEQGGIVNKKSISLNILSTAEDNDHLKIKTGFFFTEIVGGCNCDDDPIETNVYCILLTSINKTTAHCGFLIQEY